MKKNILKLFFLLILFSCNRIATETKLTKENLTDSINAKEAELKKLEVLQPNNALAFETINLYKQFADSFPNEKTAPEFLFKAANVSIGVGQYVQAIGFLERIKKNYPDYEKAPESLFLTAFIYDNHLNQKGKARDVYQQVVDKYPNHKLAADASAVMRTLEMSDEELIKFFKEKEKAAGGEESVSKK